jgi:hypothetical protein
MTSCDFVVQDLNAAADLAANIFNLVWVNCTLIADDASGVTGQPAGLLGFIPRRVISSGHYLHAEPERFSGNLEHTNNNGHLDRFAVTIAGPPFFQLQRRAERRHRRSATGWNSSESQLYFNVTCLQCQRPNVAWRGRRRGGRYSRSIYLHYQPGSTSTLYSTAVSLTLNRRRV